MTFVVIDACIKCKYTDCVEVCPVDCFYEGENMLVISPDECIDCGVCEPECPVEAIHPKSDELLKWVEQNREYSAKWPVITKKKPNPPDAREYEGMQDKFEKFFSPNPGDGNNTKSLLDSVEVSSGVWFIRSAAPRRRTPR